MSFYLSSSVFPYQCVYTSICLNICTSLSLYMSSLPPLCLSIYLSPPPRPIFFFYLCLYFVISCFLCLIYFPLSTCLSTISIPVFIAHHSFLAISPPLCNFTLSFSLFSLPSFRLLTTTSIRLALSQRLLSLSILHVPLPLFPSFYLFLLSPFTVSRSFLPLSSFPFVAFSFSPSPAYSLFLSSSTSRHLSFLSTFLSKPSTLNFGYL